MPIKHSSILAGVLSQIVDPRIDGAEDFLARFKNLLSIVGNINYQFQIVTKKH